MGIIIKAFRNFMKNAYVSLQVQLTIKIICLMILIPLCRFLLNLSITYHNFGAVVNEGLLGYIFSIEGALTLCVILGLSSICIYFEMITLTYISNNSHRNKTTTFMQAIHYTFKTLKTTKKIHLLLPFLLAGIISPIVGIGLASSILKNLTIPSFITGELLKTKGGMLLILLFFVIIWVLFIMWIIALPKFIAQNISLSKAFRFSFKKISNNKYKTIVNLLIWIFLDVLFKILAIAVHVTISLIVISILGKNNDMCQVFIALSVAIFIGGTFLISLVELPLFIAFTVEYYYKLCPMENSKDTELVLKNVKLVKSKTNKLINLSFALISLGVILWTTNSVMNNQYAEIIVSTIAHRGSSRAPENSISSVKQAIEEGADCIEIDVMLTKDNQVVLFHDATLNRIDGTNRKISDLTLEEIKLIDNGLYFSEDFRGEKIPTLNEILDATKGKVKLNIELKTTVPDEALVVEIEKLIKQYNMQSEVVISSMNYQNLKSLKEKCPEVNVGYIVSFGLGDFSTLDVDFVAVEYELLTEKLVLNLHNNNKKVYVWTTNSREHISNAIKLKVDGIITDFIPLATKEIENAISFDESYIRLFLNSIITTLRSVEF